MRHPVRPAFCDPGTGPRFRLRGSGTELLEDTFGERLRAPVPALLRSGLTTDGGSEGLPAILAVPGRVNVTRLLQLLVWPVGLIAPGKLLDLAGVGPGIEALHIAVPAGVEVSMDVDLVKIPQSFGVRDIGTLFVGVMKEQMAMMPAFTSTRATSAARRRFPRLGLKRAFSNNRHFTAFEFEPLF